MTDEDAGKETLFFAVASTSGRVVRYQVCSDHLFVCILGY